MNNEQINKLEALRALFSHAYKRAWNNLKEDKIDLTLADRCALFDDYTGIKTPQAELAQQLVQNARGCGIYLSPAEANHFINYFFRVLSSFAQ